MAPAQRLERLTSLIGNNEISQEKRNKSFGYLKLSPSHNQLVLGALALGLTREFCTALSN